MEPLNKPTTLNPQTSQRRKRKLTPRDLEIYAKLQAGGVYADIGAVYGISKQRIKQIVDKLAAHGLAVSAKAQRRDIRAATYAAAKALQIVTAQ